jgi:hypothetical protein
VVSLDTLEHVPPSARPAFLSEARRVSTGAVVLSAPFDTPGVALAERALLEFITARLSPDFPTAVWLQEHVSWGLPKLPNTLAGLGGGEWVSDALPSGYLPRWLGSMVVDHELLATGLPALNGLHAYYNSQVSPADARTPSYRHIVAASCRLTHEELNRRVASLQSAPDDPVEATAALSAMGSALLQHRLGGIFDSGRASALEHERDQLLDRINGLERVVADRDAHLAAQRERIEALEDQIARRDTMTVGARTRALLDRTTRGKLS